MGQARRNRQLAKKVAAEMTPELERELAILRNPDVRRAVADRLIEKKLKEVRHG